MKEMVNSNKQSWKIIIMLIVIIVLAVLILTSTKNKSNEQGNITKNNVETSLDKKEKEYGFIDMDNTENAKIENDIKKNISKNITKNRNIQGLLITEIELFAEKGISYLTAKVKNNSGVDFTGKVAIIQFINKDGEEYAKMEVYIPKIKNGEINTINASTTSDITNAYDFTISFK